MREFMKDMIKIDIFWYVKLFDNILNLKIVNFWYHLFNKGFILFMGFLDNRLLNLIKMIELWLEFKIILFLELIKLLLKLAIQSKLYLV